MTLQTDTTASESPPSDTSRFSSIWKRLVGKNIAPVVPPSSPPKESVADGQLSPTSALMRRVSRKVVPGLPRAKTFKRQVSEDREKLEITKSSPAERRAVSVDRRHNSLRNSNPQFPRASAPDFLPDACSDSALSQLLALPNTQVDEKDHVSLSDFNDVEQDILANEPLSRAVSAVPSTADAQSLTTSQYDALIGEELERKWILNLSMHFRDKSKREKFFVTYRENDLKWRRVTISLDYRNAPEDSLERDLLETKFQREKSSKIYEAIRESLQDIQFYDTVTNLKLQTTEGRLHVHVVEDVNEIIHYPTIRMVQHLRCHRVCERDLEFDSHMSGFVYKVRVGGQTLIKKEIPGPDTVDEFLYEVNALNALIFSGNVIGFYGVVVDDQNQHVKGLLIDYAEQGALIDIIYDAQEQGAGLSWPTREKWARQIVQGLADIHESGFVQGDFTLSNIVIDEEDNAKIIDINRRGCPVGWEPPEATPLIDSNQRISMYIGVKSDLYQLGMVLWALAMLDDEPEAHRRPLRLDSATDVPPWYHRIVEICLSDNPRFRLQAMQLLFMFPGMQYGYPSPNPVTLPLQDGFDYEHSVMSNQKNVGASHVRTITPRSDWAGRGHDSYVATTGFSDNSYYYPPRGRSPPSPLSSNHGMDSSFPATANGVWAHAPPYAQEMEDESSSTCSRDATSAETLAIAERLEEDLRSIRAGASSISGSRGARTPDSVPGSVKSQPLKINLPQVPDAPTESPTISPCSSRSGQLNQSGSISSIGSLREAMDIAPSRESLMEPRSNQDGLTKSIRTPSEDSYEASEAGSDPHYVHSQGELYSRPPTEFLAKPEPFNRESTVPKGSLKDISGVGSTRDPKASSRQSSHLQEGLTDSIPSPQSAAPGTSTPKAPGP